MGKTVIFSALTRREVEFCVAVSELMKREQPDLDLHLISFFEPANEVALVPWLKCHNFYSELDRRPRSFEVSQVIREFDLPPLEGLLFHEAITFGIPNDQRLQAKMARFTGVADALIREIVGSRSLRDVIVYQELGGFIASFCVYYSARRQGIQHIFFEPAFYKGRVTPVFNSLLASKPTVTTMSPVIPEAMAYLKKAAAERLIVVPQKDRHHYRDMGLRKLFNSSNANKIASKIKNKYIDRHRYEFDYIWNHSRRYMTMLVNRWRRSAFYTKWDESLEKQPFVYFPLHVELDYSLTVRSLSYFDQIDLLKFIASHLPPGVMLYAKEHPISVGGFAQNKVAALCREHANFRLIHPSKNSYELLEKASLIVTINSKVGAEALSVKRPVIALGDAFYSQSSMVRVATHREDLSRLIHDFFANRSLGTSFEEYERFFSALWTHSFAGELYHHDEKNLRIFSEALLNLLPNLSASRPLDQEGPG
jgi:capsule polysaccharide modification protein KpsS